MKLKGKAKQKARAKARIQQIIKDNPQGAFILGTPGDFDIPEWNQALHSYIHFQTYFSNNTIPFDTGNSIKFGKDVIQFDSDATGYFDKGRAHVAGYDGGYFGTVNELLPKMVWEMDGEKLQPQFLEWVDSNGQTATQRANWKPQLEFNTDIFSKLDLRPA